ncbi:hypothetical protein FRC09_012155 [Ceratobasidium sp. 395]|nr:hypothetical protein FRC09_012155 [Ceratobasidium sp. 395]
MARKSVNLDAWTKEQVESVKTIGNLNANAKWNPNEARNPPPTNMEESERDSEMEKYIRAKYETKRFMDRNPPSKVQTSSSGNPYASASTSATPISASASPSTARPPKPEPTDPSQTVRLGFGRESRVEFSLGPGSGVDMFDEIVQQKKPPPRSRTAPIPEPPKAVPPPAPAVPTPTSVSTLSAAFPSRSVSAQPPGAVGASGIGGMGTGMGLATAVPANPVWGDMLALQTGGPLPAVQTPDQMSPMSQNNPYASLGVSPSLPSTLANRLNQARSFTAPVNTGMGMGTSVNLGTGGPAPNPFFQQPAATGSSMLSSSSFGSGSMLSAPTGGSFGTTSSGMGVSPGGAFGGNPFGTSAGTGGSLGISASGTFGTPVSTLQTGFGASPSAFGTSTLSPQGSTQAFTPSQQQPSPFQTNTLSPFGGATSNLGASPNTNSLSAFGTAMSPAGGQMANSPFGASNSPFLQTNVPTGFQGGSSPFQTSGATPFQQSTPSSNALFLQPNSSSTPFQQSNSPFQQSNSPFPNSNSPFPNSNSPYQANTAFGQQTQGFMPANNNPFGSASTSSTNPFGPQQQQQFQAQFQNQGWGGM